MNWKLRFKNKAILTGLVGAVLLFIKQITELFGLDLSNQLEQISGLIGTILTLLAGLGVIVDPTSKGVKDSGIVQTYSEPRDANANPVEYQENSYETEQWNDDFAEEVEFKEGLRDVEDNEIIVDNFDSDINNSGVMLDTSQQVEGAITNVENSNTDK